ncbi:uncharacterized protein C9orf50 homolog [Heterocephalus glaber]|uniref:Uncharacterized protein C9orf50 homolog n=1 Tax=Heterocephalus glaber TaxID=10181 RepID=A0AAX6T9L9_HETGA|nr:uncharacterized protein C9orf50 homolog [Heterocephalus glaber]
MAGDGSAPAPRVALDGGPRAAGYLRRRAPQLPQLARPELRAARGAGGGSSWWQDGDGWPGVGVRSPSPPVPPTGTRRGQPPVLPPLLSPPAPWGSAPRRPRHGEPEAARRGLGRETRDPVGALLGELLPCKFRKFLSQLRAKCAEEEPEPEPQAQGEAHRRAEAGWGGRPSWGCSALPLQVGRGAGVRAPPAPSSSSSWPPAPSASRHQSGASEPWRRSPGCPSCQFLPDLQDQLSGFQERLEKILHQRTSSLGQLSGDHSQFPTVRKASSFCGTPAPEAMPTPTPSGEGLGPRRHSCPFQVRLADEMLTDSALCYWEHSCAVQQSRMSPLPAESVSKPGLRSLGRWLDSLPRSGYLRAKEDAMASSSRWAQPGLPSREPLGYLSKGASLKGSLPFIPRATARWPWRNLQGLPDTCSFLEQLGSCSWSQKPVSTPRSRSWAWQGVGWGAAGARPPSLVWWCIPVISARWGLRQEDLHEFMTSLGYSSRPARTA